MLAHYDLMKKLVFPSCNLGLGAHEDVSLVQQIAGNLVSQVSVSTTDNQVPHVV